MAQTITDRNGEYVLAINSDGSINISGTITASAAGDGSILDGVISSIKATVLDYTNSNPLAVRLSDTSGDYVGAGAGTQYADGATAATPTGTVSFGHDGSYVRAITTDADGNIQVDILTIPSITGTVTANVANTVTVSGTMTANAGTNLNTSLLALESGGNLATIASKDFATQTTLALIKAKTDNLDVALSTINTELGQKYEGGPITAYIANTPSVSVSSFPDNEPFNVAQFGGSAVTIGQQVAGASIPVILPSATITTLTPPAAITGFATETTLVSIKDTAGIKKITDALPAGTNALGKVIRSNVWIPADYDYMTYTSGGTTDTYVYKSGGSGGTTVGTLTITYTDGTKAVISNVAKT